MKIGIIVNPNKKGQIVIPLAIRKSLGITSDTSLHLTLRENSIVIHPIDDIVLKVDREPSFVEILKRTQGSWAGDDWEKTAKRRRKIELAASKRRKAEQW